jgi:hypothetical protein
VSRKFKGGNGVVGPVPEERTAGELGCRMCGAACTQQQRR